MQKGQDKLPTIEEAKKQLQGLSEINDPKGQVNYLKALHKACYKPESLTLLTSPSQRQSGELSQKVVLAGPTASR